MPARRLSFALDSHSSGLSNEHSKANAFCTDKFFGVAILPSQRVLLEQALYRLIMPLFHTARPRRRFPRHGFAI
jgi:hypothetical protein